MTRLKLIFGLGLTVAALLTAGCGADKPVEDQDQGQSGQQYYGPSHHSEIAPATLAPTPVATTGDDSLATADQLASGADSIAKSPGDVPSDGSGDALAGALPISTAYRHWLTVAQYDAQIKLRVNGVGQGGFAASTTTDITMVMHPGSNTITMEYAPQSANAWARVYVTRDPPLPQLMLFDSAALHTPAPTDGKFNLGAKPKPLTQTFSVLVR